MDMKAEEGYGYGGAWAWRRGGRCCAARTLAWTGSGAYYWGVLGRLGEQAGAVFCTGFGRRRKVKECLAQDGGAEEKERCRRRGQADADAETDRGTLARWRRTAGVGAATRSSAGQSVMEAARPHGHSHREASSGSRATLVSQTLRCLCCAHCGTTSRG
jgi:hypothetical protein